MGIPSFYSWLLKKYPEIKISWKEDDHLNGIKVYFNIFIANSIFILVLSLV